MAEELYYPSSTGRAYDAFAAEGDYFFRFHHRSSWSHPTYVSQGGVYNGDWLEPIHCNYYGIIYFDFEAIRQKAESHIPTRIRIRLHSATPHKRTVFVHMGKGMAKDTYATDQRPVDATGTERKSVSCDGNSWCQINTDDEAWLAALLDENTTCIYINYTPTEYTPTPSGRIEDLFDSGYWWSGHGSNNATYKPQLYIDWIPRGVTLSKPTITAPGTVKDSPHTFGCSASVDLGGFVTDPEEITYLWQVYNGSAWCEETHESEGGILTYSLDLKSAAHLNLQPLQYFYSTAIKVRVKAKCTYNGQPYESEWSESAEFAVDYRLTPSAPVVTLKRDGSEVTAVYEGEAAEVSGAGVKLTISRPETYNSHEQDGDLMGMAYAAKWQHGDTAITGTFSPEAPDSEDETVDLPFAVAELADNANKADRVTKLMAMVTPSEGAASEWSLSGNITIKRFRKPMIIAWMIARRETEADIGIYVTDTGFDYSTRENTQIASIQADKGAGYFTPTLNGWTGVDGLHNSFTLTGLDPKTQYSVKVKISNKAPDVASTLSDKESDELTVDVRQYQHAGYGAYRPDATGDEAKNLWHTPALLVHSNSEAPLNEGCAVIEKDVTLGGQLYFNYGGETGIKEYVEHQEVSGDGYVEGYYKYADGRLECYKIMERSNVNFTAWGNIYNAVLDPGDLPHPFASIEIIHGWTRSTTNSYWVASRNDATPPGLTKWGQVLICRGASATGVGFTLYMYAKGRWK